MTTGRQLDRDIAESLAKARAEELDVKIAPTLGNAIVRAAGGRNVYLIRRRLGDEAVRRITRARTKGRGMEVRFLDTGQWIGVMPEMGDRIEVR